MARSILCGALFLAALALGGRAAHGQRVLGIDVSAWQGNISQSNWNTAFSTGGRKFVFIRSSRGGTTGYDHRQDGLTPSSNAYTLSQRYDDPYFAAFITRATSAGFFAGAYHRSRADIVADTTGAGGIANNGADEANHMMQAAGAWMRPGYLPPVLDFEDGDGARTDAQMAQFALDFSNRIYQVMGIRPAIYVNGNYAQNVLGGGTSTQRSQLAQQPADPPSFVSPAFAFLWNAGWPNQSNPDAIDVQNLHPKNNYSNSYGPWDDYGVAHPWAFWQYASTATVPGISDATIDVNVAQGDMEFVKDQLIPAVWMNDSSGNWSTLANWNSGQTPVAPVVAPNQSPVQGSYTLPVARLPGAAGSGPTSGQHDTVILERPNADVTVTLSTGSHNIRKFYMRETLLITGGSLTINYNPAYVSDSATYPNALRSGPVSARFSGGVTLSGGGLNVHTLQVDATRTFTLGGGTLTFHTINLMPHASAPAKIVLAGDVNVSPLAGAAAAIARGAGSGGTGLIDLGGGNHAINVGNGGAEVDLSLGVPLSNGGFTKGGAGTMQLTAASTYSGGTTVAEGRLLVNNTSGSATGAGGVAVEGGVLAGKGSIAGTVTVGGAGRLSPGDGIGTLTVGGVDLSSGGMLDIELAGLAAGVQHDRLVLGSGSATLGGQLRVSLLNGFTPAVRDSFTILTAAAVGSEFASLSLPPLDVGQWDVDYLDNAVIVRVESPVAIVPGDFNGDGLVDGVDLAAWQENAGLGTGASSDLGDANGDGAVDGADLLLWQRNYTAGPGAAGRAAGAAVPEPAAGLLLALGALVIGRRRR